MVAHFWRATWAIRSHRSLKKREWANLSFKKNCTKKHDFRLLVKIFLSKSLICSFIMSDLSESLMVAHGRSWSLICHERPEQFAHSRSFVLSDLSDLLTVAHLSWAIWVNCSKSLIWFERNEPMSEWVMSEWANSQPWSSDTGTSLYFWAQLFSKLCLYQLALPAYVDTYLLYNSSWSTCLN